MKVEQEKRIDIILEKLQNLSKIFDKKAFQFACQIHINKSERKSNLKREIAEREQELEALKKRGN